MICDFCSSPEPAWRYPAASFVVKGLGPHASDGDWAACDQCSALIEDADLRRLILRAAIAANRRSGGVLRTSMARKSLQRIYAQFFRSRLGERRPLSS